MITYEEFKKQNNVDDKFKMIQFSDKDDLFKVIATIKDSPKEYIDVAKNAQNLRTVGVTPTQSEQYYKEFKEFVINCNDNVHISNGLIGEATKEEFLQGEEIINKIIEEINPNWSAKQKAAYVYYKMGELISYVPDFNFAGKYISSPIANNVRNIWKSLVDGKSVCNGVTAIQRNILSRVGVKTKELSSGTHSFMLVETEEGNIITDATWDLMLTLYKARPRYFGRTYEQLREEEKNESNAHKLENLPENVIEITDEELREIFHSIGLTNEDRTFKISIVSKTEEINAKGFDSMQDKLNAFFSMFTKEFPKEATHLQETRNMLEMCIGELGIEEKNLTTKYVYSKDDEECIKPYLILHTNEELTRDQIKILNLEHMQFEDMSVKQLDENYKVHDLDTAKPFWKQYLLEQQVEKSNERNLKELE